MGHLHELLSTEADALARISRELGIDQLPDGDYMDGAMDTAVSSVNDLCGRLLFAVGSHDFKAEDYAPDVAIVTMAEFIKENRSEIDQCIRGACSNLGKLTDEDREDWISNDEGLYLWAQSAGVEV